MPMTEEEQQLRPLTTSREPKLQRRSGEAGSQADQALIDAVAVIVVAWLLLFALAFSLRSYNI